MKVCGMEFLILSISVSIQEGWAVMPLFLQLHLGEIPRHLQESRLRLLFIRCTLLHSKLRVWVLWEIGVTICLCTATYSDTSLSTNSPQNSFQCGGKSSFVCLFRGFVCLFEIVYNYVARLYLPSAGITGIYHHIWPVFEKSQVLESPAWSGAFQVMM
jgi:hypothetical protein